MTLHSCLSRRCGYAGYYIQQESPSYRQRRKEVTPSLASCAARLLLCHRGVVNRRCSGRPGDRERQTVGMGTLIVTDQSVLTETFLQCPGLAMPDITH